MSNKEKKEINKCPFKIGDKVKFVPSERTIGWHQHSFDRLKIYAGYIGTITKIKDSIYIYLDNNVGGFPWTDFKKISVKKS